MTVVRQEQDRITHAGPDSHDGCAEWDDQWDAVVNCEEVCVLCAAGFADGGLGLVGSSKILLSFQLCTHTLHSPTRKPSLESCIHGSR